MADIKLTAGVDLSINAGSAKKQLDDLQKQLQQISSMKLEIGTDNLSADIEKASDAAMKLSAHLATATNPQTGNLDFTKFYTSIKKSGASLEDYGKALQNMGPTGQKAFVSLADSISKSEIPLKRTSKLMDGMWDNLKKTVGWQISSSMIHGLIGSMQQAVGYAKDLDKSLNNIRIVTGQSGEQMAQFAKQANVAAKSLSTTTTDYTKASLIYYQQGLSDAEVKARTETTIKMANATGQSAQTVSDQMTAIWNNYDNGTKSLTHYADVMTALGAATASSTDEIAEGLQKFAAISDTVGLSYEYAASALATVTSTTRESADVVGNSFKTLFSRIQGLQLGETLDDGTTLNKYSQALSSVGISIKEQSGEMKNMDTILDEMGSKWGTLAKDEKMALAQTVAGVRQYTQLMALMENWDYFKQNLNIANTSGGTLDTQAAIYAESWEAASQRVRASWEGLWDNLIDSDGMISILDGLSGFIDVLNNMVSGLGGAGGALLSFGGIMTRVFNKQIASGISDVAYGIKMLFPSQQQKAVNARDSLIRNAQEFIGKDQENTFGRDAEYAARREGMSRSLENSLLYSQNKEKLTLEQQALEKLYAKSTEESFDRMLKSSQEYDAAKEHRADFHGQFYDKNMANNLLSRKMIEGDQVASISDNVELNFMERIASIEAHIQAKTERLDEIDRQQKNDSALAWDDNLNNERIRLHKEKELLSNQLGDLWKGKQQQALASQIYNRDTVFGTQEDYLRNANKQNHQSIISKLQEQREIKGFYGDEFKTEATDKNSQLYKDQQRYKQLTGEINTLRQQNDAAKSKLSQPVSFSEALTAQGEATAKFNQALTTMDTTDAETFMQSLNEFTHTASNSMGSNEFMKNAINMAEEFRRTGDKGAFAEKFAAMQGDISTFMRQSMDSVTGAIYDTFSNNEDFIGKGMSREEFMQQAADAYRGTAEKDIKMRGAIESYTKQMDARNENLTKKPGADKSASERLVSGASGAMEALAAGEAIKSFTTSLQDGSATLTSSLTSIISAIMQGVSGFQGLSTALTGLGGLSAGAASAIALVATALLALASIAAEFYDQTHTNNKEMMQNLSNSNNELATASSAAAEAAETAKIQNEDYLKGVEKIKSLSQDPTTLAEDVYESNKKALELINQYGLQNGIDYSTSANGLIEIKRESLQQEEVSRDNISQNTDYAALMGQALNQQRSNEIERSEDLFSQVTDGFFNEINRFDKGLWANKEQKAFLEKYNTDGDASRFNIAELAQIYQDGQLQQYTELFSKTSSLENLTTAIEGYLKNEANAGLDDTSVSNAADVVANKALADNGITAATQEGFTGYQAAVADSIKQQFQEATDIVDTTNNKILNEDAIKQILESQGQKGAHGFRMDSGVVYYTLDGESQERSYTGETLNHLNAANQIDVNKAISEVTSKWNEMTTKLADGTAEARFQIQELGTIDGASADSVQALFNADTTGDIFKSAYGDNQDLADKEYEQVKAMFGPGGIVTALGLDSDTLSKVSMGTLETLQNQAEGMGAKGATYFRGLFAELKEATGAETSEDLAKIVTALSSMDFSDSAYSNLLNLKSTLEAFGFSVDTSGLEALYAILAKLAGLSPGGGIEDLADTNKKITENRGALNKIAPDQVVDQATRDAGVAAGLNANDFVKDENGNYIYNGSQQDIKYAKGVADRAFASNQFLTNQAQSFYEDAFGDGTGQTYESFQDLYDAAAASESGVADFINKLGLDLSSTDSDTQNQILKAYNQAIENGQTSEETQQANISDYMAQITSANDMMNAVRNNLFSGNGFIDEDGIISDEVMARLDSFPATSERVAESFNALKAARENYQEAINDKDPNNDMDADNLYNQAMANYDLATAIDAVAEARGLDAEQVAFYTEQLQNLMDADELSRYSPDALADLGADLAEQKNAIDALNKAWGDLSSTLSKDELTEDKGKALKQLGKYLDQLTNSTLTAGKSFSDLDKGYQKFLDDGGNMQKVLNGDRKEITKLARAMEGLEDQTLDSTSANKRYGKTYGDIYKAIDEAGEKIDDSLEEGLITPESFMGDAATQQQNYDALKSMLYNMTVDNMKRTGQSWEAAAAETAAATGYALVQGVDTGMDEGLGGQPMGLDTTAVQTEGSDPPTNTGEPSIAYGVDYSCEDCGHGYFDHIPKEVSTTISGSQTTAPAMDGLEVHKMGDAPKGTPAGGGGGGGGQPKEPKKVAVKRKSQIVKRYKQNDFKREHAAHAKKSEENKKDYLYGEQKISQLEKINKLTEKEAHITADRIKESREYLVEDRQNLIKMLSKYGFDAEFEKDGFLASYEKVWNEIYQEIAALYEDNLLTEEESAIEEDLNIKLEELEGALEDYENSLKELADDIEKYEESLYEMYDNKVEALEHKIEFKIELEEDDLEYLDWWIETLGDSVYNAIEAIEAMGNKANMLFNGLDVYKQGIEDIYALSEDPFQAWATGSLNPELLTQDQVDMLRENRDGLMDYAQQLVELREEIKDKVIDTFDLWTERIDASRASLEHYTAVIEHFKNIIDISGQDALGLNDAFMDRLAQSAINSSMNHIEANKAYYESLIEQQAKAQEELDAARARGDESSAEHWEEVVRTTTEAMETAQDELLTSLEDTLTMIADQFELAMQRAIDAFNDAIYTYGGMEGLSTDYGMIRENADLMAADYEKIYNLSKLTRDINKTLNDSSIIVGKQKMTNLLKEINELQASGVELSKYDLEYLQARYELRLAEIELENAKNSKDTVMLSKDSEGNWSYIYTQNVDAVEEAEQKYEDALYKMQNLSQEYLEEMSASMIDTSTSMVEEISALRIQDFTSYEAYQAEVKRIQDKYAETLKLQEEELNKAVNNNQNLYQIDWENYNKLTGYKISANQDWVDSFKESTLGELLNSDEVMSAYSELFLGLTDTMSKSLGDAALQYFTNIDAAMNKYGTSIGAFGTTVSTTVENISGKSKTATEEIKNMAVEMKDAFIEIADVVSEWQEKFSTQIDEMLDQISTLVQEINEAIRKSAELAGEAGSTDLIGSAEAVELLNAAAPEGYKLGSFALGSNGQITANGQTYNNWLDYNASLVEEIDAAIAKMANAHTGTEERKKYEEELAILFAKYHAFRDIVNRIYDNGTNDTLNLSSPNYVSMDTGGYTGEWGKDGKIAMLHEKELVLNSNDTSNFLEALAISKDIINKMIEMNAKASELALGDLRPNSVQDFASNLEQQVSITAEFPNATDHNEIEEAFYNLINTASQYANRFKD